MRNGRALAFVVAGLLLVALIAGMLRARRTPRVVAVTTVATAPFAVELPESGVVQYPQIQTMSSQIGGNVASVLVHDGERVTAGQLLMTIANPQIVANAQSLEAAYRSASARATSAEVTGGTNVALAQANLEAARARLAQAQQDAVNGVQSGLGYGETTAAAQRAQLDANLANAETNLREARRLYLADRDLYAEKAISHDQLDQAEARYEQAQTAYAQARVQRTSLGAQLSRSRTVLSDNLRSAQEGLAQATVQLAAARVESEGGDVAAARAEAARAGADYALARRLADATAVRAPYDATVLSVATQKGDSLRPLQPGDAVAVGQPLVTLAAKRAFVVRMKIDEQDAIDVAVGDRASITSEDFPGRTLSGRVVEIAPIATSHTVAASVRIDRPPAFLRDGMTADVEIFTMDEARALVVPDEAIARDGAAAYVFVVRDGIAHRQPVRVRASNETGSAIESGLRAGDVIVARDVAGLTDGAAVLPSPSPRSSRS